MFSVTIGPLVSALVHTLTDYSLQIEVRENAYAAPMDGEWVGWCVQGANGYPDRLTNEEVLAALDRWSVP